MITDMIKGIALQLRTVYPQKDYRVYTEQVQQGLREPCFFICLLNDSKTPFLGPRSRRDYFFDVRYHPADDVARYASCQEAAQTLYDCLEYIPAGKDLIRGTGMSSQVIEDVLHFFVTYRVFFIHMQNKEFMEEVGVYAANKE